MEENICLSHGLLVGMRDRLPVDEAEYYRQKGQIVGCNRIFCRLCQSWVKHLDGYRIWSAPLQREQYERLYETLDPNLFDAFMADPEDFRTYVCRCNWADTPGIKRLEGGDIDGWSCAGHPSTPA